VAQEKEGGQKREIVVSKLIEKKRRGESKERGQKSTRLHRVRIQKKEPSTTIKIRIKRLTETFPAASGGQADRISIMKKS